MASGNAVRICGQVHENVTCLQAHGHMGQCTGEIYDAAKSRIVRETELKGGRVNYYLIRVEHPQREDQPPYTAECEDIGEALKLTPDEMNIFKEIWRSANARQGNGKPDHKALYGAEKIVHYAGRILRKLRLTA